MANHSFFHLFMNMWWDFSWCLKPTMVCCLLLVKASSEFVRRMPILACALGWLATARQNPFCSRLSNGEWSLNWKWTFQSSLKFNDCNYLICLMKCTCIHSRITGPNWITKLSVCVFNRTCMSRAGISTWHLWANIRYLAPYSVLSPYLESGLALDSLQRTPVFHFL